MKLGETGAMWTGVRYLATGHDPVGDGEERQSDSNAQNRQTLHTDGLLPQTRQVLVPDRQ